MEDIKRKSWFGRNWPWVLPVGGCLTIIILFALGAGAIFFGVSKIFKSSAPYTYAVERAFENEDVIDFLGEPLETDGIISGNISLKNDEGEADFEIPIAGKNGDGSIIVVANKINDEWVYEKLYVLIKETKEEINLLDKGLEGI
ncbi:cytochrome c oxidase assembly factor Coa1 family protein [Flavivirga amylovorans]|uniref:Cytochrome c oxidase assembly factor Coa1 family protein n=1 Tax=Flavivirga amylovorans TaxID=870486 RepID=A0ABT8X2J6_9FLAO|nr:cytochrome c oxidase assembly factor Coa1 family protein [Flavivirga amylovorans]MDO5988139.1 cytochrome c oxidase assembly factor Coa1 family protein [Flavivirga amylovorans]